MSDPAKPLHGRLILDCSTLLPGPFIGKLLALRGARVIKVENPDRPDGARLIGNGYYPELNGEKELVWANLTLPTDREKFRPLVKQAHGLIEGFRPAAKKKLGLDAESLHAINPDLCILSLVGYPEDGSWCDRAGHDLNFQAVTGTLSLFKEMPGLPLADLFAAYDGALGMACALDAAARGGGGRRLVVAMSETLKDAQGIMIRGYRETGELPAHGSTLMSGKFPCYRIYRAADGRGVTVGAIEDKFWVRFCGVLGLPELQPHGYATGPKGAETIALVQKTLGARPWTHWAPLFEAADCCVEPILDYAEVYGGGV